MIAAFGAEVMHARYRARRPGGTALDLLADLATEQTYPRPAMRFADTIAKRGGNAPCLPYEPGTIHVAVQSLPLHWARSAGAGGR